MVVGLPKPLFVAPKAMASVSQTDGIGEELAHSSGAYVREYRGFGKIKPSWSNFSYKVPESILIVRRPTVMNAAEWGVQTLAGIEARCAL